MYLRAGLISVVLLVTSRALGLARESVQAASFGVSGTADVAVAMLTLPDLLSSALTTGALAYVLLPWWAGQSPAQVARSQRQLALRLLGLGALLGLLMWLSAPLWAQALVPASSADPQLFLLAGHAVRWAALAMPLALLSFLWYTRCQHERDAVGMYGMNVVHTSVVITVMVLAAGLAPGAVVWALGVGMLLAYLLRLGFLAWRLRRLGTVAQPATPLPIAALPNVSTLSGAKASLGNLPPARLWLWALLAAGLPALLPIVARSMLSGHASGALALFNYAYKLVELPNTLAIALVATLAFPALTRAYAGGLDISSRLQLAWGLSWTLACAAVLGLVLGAQPLAVLLFGWGKMDASSVNTIAQWASAGAWTLLPQSVLSVLLLVLATLGRLKAAAWAYASGLAVLWLAMGWIGGQADWGPSPALGTMPASSVGINIGNINGISVEKGRATMLALSAALWVAVAVAASAVWPACKRAWDWKMASAPLLLCGLALYFLSPAAARYSMLNPWFAGVSIGFIAILLIAVCTAINPRLRAVFKR